MYIRLICVYVCVGVYSDFETSTLYIWLDLHECSAQYLIDYEFPIILNWKNISYDVNNNAVENCPRHNLLTYACSTECPPLHST